MLNMLACHPHLSKIEPFAVCDIGANSVRIVIYNGKHRVADALYNQKFTCKLGKTDHFGRLTAASKAKAISAMQDFRNVINSFNVKDVFALATAGLRDAEDGAEFAKELSAALGITVNIISGETEARYAAKGVLFGFPKANGLIADLGGGSVELAFVNKGKAFPGQSFPLGILKLQAHQTTPNDFTECENYIAGILANTNFSNDTLYTVGGSWRAFALLHMIHIDHPLRIIHGYSTDAKSALKFCKLLQSEKFSELKRPYEISKRRFLGLPFSATLLTEMINRYAIKEIVFSANGLREGVLMENLPPEEQKSDPHEILGKSINLQISRKPETTEALFSPLSFFIDRDHQEEADLIRFFCRRSDIAWRRHPDYRALYAYEDAIYGTFFGLTHENRIFLALAGAFRNNSDYIPNLKTITSVSPQIIKKAKIFGIAAKFCYVTSLFNQEIMERISFFFTPDGKLSVSPKALLKNETAEKIFQKLSETIASL